MRFVAAIFILIFSLPGFAQEAPAPDTESAETKPKPPPPKPLWVAHILREKRTEARLADLYIHEAKVPVTLVAREGGFRPFVEVRGRFYKPGWILTVAAEPVRMITPEGDFSIPAYLSGKVNEVTVNAKGPNGEFLSERVFIYSPDAQEYKQVSPWDAVLIGIGGGFMHYSQTHSVYFKSLTGLVFGKLNWPPRDTRWSFFLGANATGVTVAAAPIEVGPQLVRVKADVVYRMAKKPLSRWSTEWVGGLSYLTMISNGSPFGFSNLIAAEGGVRLRYVAGPKTTLITELRYIPIKDPLKFEDKGFDFEFTWSRILPNVHRLEVGFSYYNFNYHPTPDTRIDTGLLVYRVGYGI